MLHPVRSALGAISLSICLSMMIAVGMALEYQVNASSRQLGYLETFDTADGATGDVIEVSDGEEAVQEEIIAPLGLVIVPESIKVTVGRVGKKVGGTLITFTIKNESDEPSEPVEGNLTLMVSGQAAGSVVPISAPKVEAGASSVIKKQVNVNLGALESVAIMVNDQSADLTLERDITFLEEEPLVEGVKADGSVPGGIVKVSYTITNVGSVPTLSFFSEASLKLNNDAVLSDTRSVRALGAGGSARITHSFRVKNAKVESVTAVIDPKGTINEDKSNNQATKKIQDTYAKADSENEGDNDGDDSDPPQPDTCETTNAEGPGAPTVYAFEPNQLRVKVIPSPNAINSSTTNDGKCWTRYAIREETTRQFVQADGALKASPDPLVPYGAAVYKTDQEWGLVAVKGLKPNVKYVFNVDAKNMNDVHSGWGPETARYTLPNEGLAPIITNISTSSLQLQINTNDGNPANVRYEIYVSKYLYKYIGDGGWPTDKPVLKTAAEWGKVVVRGLTSGQEYVFYVSPINNEDARANSGNLGIVTK